LWTAKNIFLTNIVIVLSSAIDQPMTIINFLRSSILVQLRDLSESRRHHFLWGVLLCCSVLLSACSKSQPSTSEIKQYIENYQVVHNLKVASMDYEIKQNKDGKSGTIQASGRLSLAEALYVEDKSNQVFRKDVAEALRRNRFSEREINHDIYNRVIQATTRVPGDKNEYYTFLKVEYEPGLEINFSAELTYQVDSDGIKIDGKVRHANLLGSRVDEFSNPILDDSELVKKALTNVLAEQARYRELMEDSRTLLTRLWDNDHGLVLWNRKTSYLGNENLSKTELSQLSEFKDWRGVYHISNIRAIEYRTPHASNFFELGTYITEGIATCLRQTGFTEGLTYLKSQFNQYCEFGKQYPIQIKLSSTLNQTNDFVAKAMFVVGGVNSGELSYGDKGFNKEHNELARYSDQLKLVILNDAFDIKHHNQPVFSTAKVASGKPERLRLQYTGDSDYQLAGLNENQTADDQIADNTQPSEQEKPEQQAIVDARPDASNNVNPSSSAQDDNDTPASATIVASVEKDTKASTEIINQQAAKEAAEKELVKSIQIELKRLGLYNSTIDGIAGRYTHWAIRSAQKQLNKGNVKRISNEFLDVLRVTSTASIKSPSKPYQPVSVASVSAKNEQEKKPKGTLAGQAFRWVGKQFGKKKDQPQDSK